MGDAEAARSLLSAQAVRERAHEMLAAGLRGELEHFTVDLESLSMAAHVVSELIRVNYPDLKVPFHARWRHFVIGARDLWAERVAQATRWKSPAAKARAEFDLAITSVLLDAGAGPGWKYLDPATEQVISRSEGLAVASLRMFEAGAFSSDPADPLRADAERLVQLKHEEIADGFQSMVGNRLVGVEGRAELLASLGKAVTENPKVFAREDSARPGGLYDYLAAQAEGGRLAAPRILEALLEHLGPIWPSRLMLGGVPLGDTWHHPAIRRDDATNGLVPIHKLSQWLSYSLIEPLQWSGITVTDIEGLTGLAEYRNGGLFVDAGVLRLRESQEALHPNPVDSTLVVEWRALTVALLDEIAKLIREQRSLTIEQFPLACVLEGGTWAAGRRLARDKRADGSPPIAVESDGTVF
ncbi:MAG: URC4/urg3 family protein [Xanthobacteraceae bacterium]